MGILLFSFLSFLCLISGDTIFYTLGRLVQGFYLGFFGYASFIALGLFILLGIRLVVGKPILSKQVCRMMWLILLIAFSVMAIVETAVNFDSALNFSQNFSAVYLDGNCDFSTASAGGALMLVFIRIIGSVATKAGCYILFSMLIALSLILIFRAQIALLFTKKSERPAKSAKKNASAKKKHSADGSSESEEVSDISDGNNTEDVYRRPSYIGNGDFGIKTKRDYKKPQKHTDIFGGTLYDGGNTKNSDGADSSDGAQPARYSDAYGSSFSGGRNLSPEARYIMTPPEFDPDALGQSPVSATNPSSREAVPDGTANGYDDSSLGGNVYTVGGGSASSAGTSRRFADRGADSSQDEDRYSPSDRGGLFDGIRSDRGTDFSDGSTRTRGGSAPVFGSNRYTDSLEERLGVTRGKQQRSTDGDGAFDSLNNDDSYTDDLPNADKVYTPETPDYASGTDGGGSTRGMTSRRVSISSGRGEGLFGTSNGDTDDKNSDRYDTFNPDAATDDTDSSDTDFSVRTYIRGASAGASTRTRTMGGDLPDSLRGREVSSRIPVNPPQPAAPSVSEPAQDSSAGSFVSQTGSELAKMEDEFDPNEGYESIEDMPLNYNYTRPPLNLLYDITVDPVELANEKKRLFELAQFVEQCLKKRGVVVTLMDMVYGMSITRFVYSVPTETPVSRILACQKDISVWIAAEGSLRILTPIPGTSNIGIEVPNAVKTKVGLKELLKSQQYKNIPDEDIYIPIGKNVMGVPVFESLTLMPHLLIAGATGTGKSVFLNAMLMQLIYRYSPEDLRIVIVDPKQLEFVNFYGLPHLMFNKIITEPGEAAAVLRYLIQEMDERYALFARTKVKKISQYNRTIDRRVTRKLPYILVLIDEFGDLMMKNPNAKKDIEASTTRLAQLARAAGISLVFATQRPTTDVIDGTIKNNFPARICLKTADYTNSQVVLGEPGAEKLLGKGDLLYKITGGTERAQGAYLEDEEIVAVVDYIKKHNKCYYDKNLFEYVKKVAKSFGSADDGEGDGQMSMDIDVAEQSPKDMPVVYHRAVRLVIMEKVTSKSLLQTKLGIGYNKAARIVDWMEKMGYISRPLENKQREIRITQEEYEQVFEEPFNPDYTK